MDCGAYGGEQTFLTTMTAHTLTGNYRLGFPCGSSAARSTRTPRRPGPSGPATACTARSRSSATRTRSATRWTDRWEFRRRNVLGDGDLGATGQVFEGDVLGPMLGRMEALRAQRPAPPADGRLLGTAVTVGDVVRLRRPVVRHGQPEPRRQRDPHHRGRRDRLRLARAGAAADRRRPARDAPGGRRRPGGRTRTPAATTWASAAGGTTVSLGSASAQAGDEVRRKLLDVAARHARGVAGGPRAARTGTSSVVGAPGSRVTVLEVVAHANATSGPISGTGVVHRAAAPARCPAAPRAT